MYKNKNIIFKIILLAAVIYMGVFMSDADTALAAGNSISEVIGIGLKSTVNGSITETNKCDFYRVDVPDNSSVELRLTLTSYMYDHQDF